MVRLRAYRAADTKRLGASLMARETFLKVTCDRCKQPIVECAEAALVEAGRKTNQGSIFIDAKTLGLGEIVLEDLDDRCRAEVLTLLRDIISRPEVASASAEPAPEVQATPRPPDEDASPAAPATEGETMRHEDSKAAMPEDKDDETEREHEREEEEEEEEEDEK